MTEKENWIKWIEEYIVKTRCTVVNMKYIDKEPEYGEIFCFNGCFRQLFREVEEYIEKYPEDKDRFDDRMWSYVLHGPTQYKYPFVNEELVKDSFVWEEYDESN